MKIFIIKLIPKKLVQKIIYIKNNYFGGYTNKSYSQEGEDLILNRIFGTQQKGFYIDVGAHHPKRFSNTYYFYKKGWTGINIDAMPGSMKLFNIFRKKDINLEMPISNTGDVLTYYVFNEPALNTFSKELALSRGDNNKAYFIQKEVKLKTYKLSEILDKYLQSGTQIDFLSIDVEGLDFEVIKSNDWNKYLPLYILIELLDSSNYNIETDEISRYLQNFGYSPIIKTVNTVFFMYKKE